MQAEARVVELAVDAGADGRGRAVALDAHGALHDLHLVAAEARERVAHLVEVVGAHGAPAALHRDRLEARVRPLVEHRARVLRHGVDEALDRLLVRDRQRIRDERDAPDGAGDDEEVGEDANAHAFGTAIRVPRVSSTIRPSKASWR